MFRLPQKEIDTLSRFKKRDPLKYLYVLSDQLQDKEFQLDQDTGASINPYWFESIFRNLTFNQEKIPFIMNPFGDVTNIDAFSKTYY